MLTLGLCNIVGSGFQSMPVSGAFSRAAISSGSGIKTPMANMYSGKFTYSLRAKYNFFDLNLLV